MTEDYKALDRQGYTSTVYYIPCEPPRVCKAFSEDRVGTLYATEKAAYERFTANDHPPSILKYYGIHDSTPAGITLEFAEKKDLHEYLWVQKQVENATPSNMLLYRWARQAVEALAFAHSLGVYNSDIHCINFFLDRDLNLKVGDWAGASIDGSISRSSYRLRYRLFDAEGTDVPRSTGISPITEIFAFGTALFAMVAGHEPWRELREPEDRDEIKRRIREKEFPDTSILPVLGDVIRKSWHVEYTTMTEIGHAIDAEIELKAEAH